MLKARTVREEYRISSRKGNALDPVKPLLDSYIAMLRFAILPKQSTEPPWYVIRMPGGVGGEESRGSSLSRLAFHKENIL